MIPYNVVEKFEFLKKNEKNIAGTSDFLEKCEKCSVSHF